MSVHTERKYASIYLDDGNCSALLVTKEDHSYHSGITEKNVDKLVSICTGKGYHTTLYRVGNPEYFVEKENVQDS